MLNRIVTPELLNEQAAMLKSRKFKAGFDGMDADSAVLWLGLYGNEVAR